MSGRVALKSNAFLIDTNILIYYFNGIELDEKIDEILSSSFNISIITKIEFLSWQKLYRDKILEEKAILFFSSRHFSNSPNSNFLKTKANSLLLCS